ncbi:MAG: M20/M25/M40 family metallo-hydrolase [Bacteroidetes bacterium]|nr:M20/M25/M40 family metallo-hydrolase [Bacteroidota bacterium]MBS1931400.1 M20/M25/M40 family metallo-hydrolase [Bacteroidota bacterium]
MKLLSLTGLLLLTTSFLFAQNIDEIINAKEAERIEQALSSDEMRGRRAFTPDIDRAADFISDEFKKIGLQTWNNGGSYRQEFSMVRSQVISVSAVLDGVVLAPRNIAINSGQTELNVNQSSGYELETIKAGTSLFKEAFALAQSGKNIIVLVDTSYASNFSRLSSGKRASFKSANNVIYLLTNHVPKNFSIEAKIEISEQKLANVVGILPGKSRKNDYVIFSAHYDHLGVGKPVKGDSIYNGANDDAAGTTAVIMLAKYFKQLNNNERTIVFAAFTAEEVGGYGSQYFSKQFDPDKVVAMFNIEMIGTDSKWGKNSAYITGYDKTDMGAILQKNLEGTGFTFYPDPYPQQNLFYRSDNATLARLGVPAHTISTAKMGTPPEEPSEPNYHKVSDQIETLDMSNMAMIIKAIALSSRGIVGGKETPTRVEVEELR